MAPPVFFAPPSKDLPIPPKDSLLAVFIVSGNMSEKKFFDAWMDKIAPSTTYDFNYKSDYSADIIITQYDITNESQYNVILREAYPITVNQLDLDWSAEGYHKLAVVFAYTYWSNNFS